MKNTVQQQLFKHIEKHVEAYLKQWQRLQPLSENICDPGKQQYASIALTTLLASYDIKGSIHGQLPGTIHMVWSEQTVKNKPSLLLYIPIKQPGEKYLAPLFAWLVATATYQKVMGSLPMQIQCILATEKSATGQANNDIIEVIKTGDIPAARGCIWYTEEQLRDALPLFALGCKGCLQIGLVAQTARIAPSTNHDAIVPNALWRLIWVLNSFKNEHEEILIPGFYDDLKPEADEHIAAIQELPDNAQQYVQALGIAQPLLGLRGFQFHYTHLLTPTCTVHELRRFDNNEGVYGVPEHAQASVLFHLVPDQQPTKIFRLLAEYLQAQGCTEIELHLKESRDPRKIAPEEPLAQALQNACAEVYGPQAYFIPMSAGSYPFESITRDNTMPVIFDVGTIRNRSMLEVGNSTQLINSIKHTTLLIHNMTNIETQ